MGVNQRLLLDLEDPFPPQVSDYERCAGERDADADGGEGLVDGVGDDEGGRAGAQVARRRQLLADVGEGAQQAHYVEAAAREGGRGGCETHLGLRKALIEVARSVFLLFLNCYAWPCLRLWAS